MLSRRQLRIRVMQALYAFFQDEQKDVGTAQNDLIRANQRSYDLYLQLLLLLPELARHEEVYKQDAQKKYSKKEVEALNILKENFVVKWLESNFEFNEKVRSRRLSWQEDQEMVNKISFQLRGHEKYKAYIAATSLSDAEQIEFCKWIIQFVSENEVLTHTLEEKNIVWAESFSMISHMVEKTIGQLNPENLSGNKIMSMYRDSEDDMEFMRKLLSEVVKNDEEFTKMIGDKTKNWEVDRIALMDVLLLKMALAEVISFENIPVKVSINEYLDISKLYSTPKSNTFINGVIDKLVADLKKAGKVQKTGRGLVE